MRYAIASLAILLFFSSCSDNSGNNNLIVYRIAEEGLQQSNKNISTATDMVYHGFQNKLNEPAMKEIAEYWQPKALTIKNLSDSMVKYINGLKEELKNEAGGDDSKNKNWENAMGVSEHLFESHGKGKELLEALIKYKETLLSVDPKVKSQFEHTINIFSNKFTYTSIDTTAFTKNFFSNIPVIAANVMLSKFANNVKIFENETVTYCHNQIGMVDGPGFYTKFSFIAGVSSTYLKAGEELEISAGMGEFGTSSKPQIMINGKIVSVNENAVAVYKLKTPQKAGKYSVPVKIEYTKPDGTKESVTRNLKYTVIEPK